MRITKPALTAMAVMVSVIVAARAADADPATPATATATATAVTGDTIVTGGKRYCLFGIDAPEPGQHCTLASGKRYDCGRIATTALMDLLAGASVRCKPTGNSRQDCAIARCEADGFDLSANMVHTGWALADREGAPHYHVLQTRAKHRRHGLWRGTFDPPWNWRRKQSPANK